METRMSEDIQKGFSIGTSYLLPTLGCQVNGGIGQAIYLPTYLLMKILAQMQ